LSGVRGGEGDGVGGGEVCKGTTSVSRTYEVEQDGAMDQSKSKRAKESKA
jgi:hypothetical protein